MIVRGKFIGSKVINLFYEGGYKDPTNLTEKWTKIVKKSAKTCDKEVQTESDISSEDYIFFYTKFIECIRMENFLNCPELAKTTNCQKIKEMMTKCDDSNYQLLHEFFFEEFYYKNNKNVTLKWTTRTTTLGTPYPTEKTTVETTERSTDSTAKETAEETTSDDISTTEEFEATELKTSPQNKTTIKKVTQASSKTIAVASTTPNMKTKVV